ncbi:MAG: PAS domain S-box protein [Dethiobacter sp.]|jgi:PAS domain S-box-containing protein/putative nucleotidyltransferase with HDIG domain|nr:PAS domain S-box protein [Dethiobacter sp.]
MKILIISDNNLLKQVESNVKGSLEIWDRTNFVATIDKAMEAAADEHPDIVIIDVINIPDSVKLLQNFKSLDEDTQVLVLIDPKDNNITEIVNNGVDCFILKPYMECELINRIKVAKKIREKLKNFRKKEKSIKKREEHFRTLVDLTPDWDFLLDVKENFLYVSGSSEKITGYKPEDFLQDKKLLEKITHPDDVSILLGHIHYSFSSSEMLTIRFRILHRSGEVRWIEQVCQPFYDSDGELLGRRSSNRDVTRQKQIEEDLKKSEATLRRITDNMTDLICQIDITGVIKYISPSYKSELGYKEEDLIGRRAFDFVHPDDLAIVTDMFQKGLERKMRGTVECRFRHAEGHYLWLETMGKLLQDDVGEIIGGIFSSRNISKRKRIEEERNRLFNISIDMLGIADLNGYLKELNPAWEKTLGWKTEELLSKPYLELVHPEDREATINAVGGLTAGKPVISFNNRYLCQDGSYKWFSWAVVPVVKDNLTYFSAKDITDLKKAEEALQMANDGLKQKVRERTAKLAKINKKLAAKIIEQRELQKTLLESETRYRTLINNVPIGIYRTTPGPEGRILMANPTFFKIFDIENEKMLGNIKAVDLYINPEERKAFSNELLMSGNVTGVELNFKKTDGTPIWGSVKASAICDEHGEIEHFDCTVQDITLQKRAMELLRAGDALLKKLSERVPGAIYQYQYFPDGRSCFPYASEGIREIYEVTPEEVRQDAAVVFQRLHKEDYNNVVATIMDSFQTLQPWVCEYRVVLPTYGEKWIRGSSVPERLDDGSVLWHGFATDITVNKQKEEELRTRKDELSVLFNLSTCLRTAANTADLIPIMLDEVQGLLKADSGIVTLLSPDGMRFSIALGNGLWKDSTGQTFPVDQGLSGIVLRTGKLYVSENYGAESQSIPLPYAAKIGHSLFVPMLSEDEQMIGVLAVARRLSFDAQPFNLSEMHVLTAIGEMAGTALRRLRLYESTQKHLNQVKALRNIDMAITGSLDLRVTFKVILNEITSQLGINAAAILRFDSHSQTLRYEAWVGFSSVKPENISLRLGEGFAGRAALKRQSIQIPDLHKAEQDADQGQILLKEGFAAYYAVPLIAKGLIHGVLEVYHRKPFNSHGDWLQFLETLAGQTAIAIDNAELFHNLEQSNIELMQAYNDTIEGWARALDMRDQETEDHSQRVAKMTVNIARKFGVKEEKLAYVRRGALLHDIGKMGIPDNILRKPGKLTDEEWEIMRRHPRLAYEMLSPIEYLRPALEIPYCHHEKWDGTGYPRGLKGKEIPLEARIFALADVYDALTSERPYRSAWSKEKALEYIKEQSGRYFDPQVVEVFLQEFRVLQ